MVEFIMPLSMYFSILGAMLTVHRPLDLENRLGNWTLVDDSFASSENT